ncbi:MAG: AmmeMemoRadiSam system radical SAM enzyme [Omnitrophica bacterium RIFCSPLOWO2_12_FULL_44_17]|uniref:AmmeMemoRadiSam system radical SAM enzyme n=1 Tax=Candidatus Danuiimicrobium aquiferis TaxID=1801832 RepID=A0A1G1KSE9_9BACT|nr:MAG: AmmeMemoRadiSam system radical SAM enzyme [Omnitrophica bacterium RIFCSPHIGHO2_02_FULL_45_28]OGW91157.1 MAG: AmmeMemoRadiSam system radical SAM enzyme [Omnitrophica bacterium RIFCSPHIGHO2_12_FULL_44_12]OGW95479.1 MAG: AmmeMemoRadiSam system radical SAM enzyme [Omnitrophica bacterium RIFCSPLOWO2_12_FULL_44_17]OGX03358.1 MAG: AmmeMemoRadiSam system radical SAM enzyme [Omnitrophica bacterium RIFCSPLOWO2_02_FULL_44_11]
MIKRAEWEKLACLGVQCELCPFRCFLPEGSRGICKVRMNVAGKLRTLVYAQPVSVHIDPIEKKPVYHMLPGSRIFSIATVGCNLKCSFCQNWEISQSYPEQAKTSGQMLTPAEVVDAAIKSNSHAIAYTYSEPVVFYEYVLDTAKLAKQKGLRNVMVSAGYINPEPLKKLAPYFDVIKIDLKGFNEQFYRKVVGGDLKFVLETLKELKHLGVFTEIVNLVVPGLNDDMDEITEMCKWIHENLGPDTPLFFSRFTPQYRLGNLPPTPVETLEKAREIALKSGLRYVYIGNVTGHSAENTYCPNCGQVLIRRYGYAVLENHIRKGRCIFCGKEIPGIWED